jgi:hypothetical protein
MFDNAVTRAVARMDQKLEGLDAETIARLEANSTLDGGDWLQLGDMASRAMVTGKIDAETAQTIHGIHTRFNSGASLAERMVFLQVSAELLAARI